MAIQLDEGQLEAVSKLDNGKVLWGGVGSGKTLTALHYYVERESPRDLYVITTAKKRNDLDWEKEAASFGISGEVSAHGNLTVDSWQNIKKYQNVYGAFFIFDEQRLVGSGTWVKAFLKIARRNRWILLSATPGDTWIDYIPVFVANGYYRNRTEFKAQHVVYSPYSKFPKIDRYIGVGKLVRLRKEVLVKLPYTSKAKRRYFTLTPDYDTEKYRQVTEKRWHIWEDRPLKNVSEQFQAMRKVVNSDPSRLALLEGIMAQFSKVIIFYNFDYELVILRKFLDEKGMDYAEHNGHKHEPIPSKKERWCYLVQYMAGSEAWNCIDTNVSVFWSLNYSYKVFEQSSGRIDRRNTPFTELFYYILLSKAPIDRRIWSSIKSKKNFNEPKNWE